MDSLGLGAPRTPGRHSGLGHSQVENPGEEYLTTPHGGWGIRQSHSAGTSGRPFYTHFLVYTKSVLVEQSTPVFLTLEEAAVDAHADSVHARSMQTCSQDFAEYVCSVLCIILNLFRREPDC